MNLEQLNDKLLAAARAHAPSDRVPYAFEQRIMARLSSRSVPDTLTLWGQALFRGALTCAAIMLTIGTIAVFFPEDAAPELATNAGGAAPELAQEFQDILLAAVDSTDPVDLNEEIQ
jgi:hypothetical protein